MNESKKRVTVLEFRRLLFELKEHRPDICIRHRAIGQMWAQNFLRVVRITERGVVLNDESSKKFLNIRSLDHVMQFELDKPFQTYQPYFHYDVVPSPET